MDILGMPTYWPFNHLPIEYLWASLVGTMFSGHRGNMFFKLIRILSRGPILISAIIPTDSDGRLNIRCRDVYSNLHQPQIFKVLWYNAAQPNPGRIESRFPFEDHLKGTIESESPDILIFSSTGSGISKHQLAVLLGKLSYTQLCQQDVGNDGGLVSVSYSGNGTLTLNLSEGNNIETGVEFEYRLN